MADQLRVNGNLESWGSIVIKLDNERFYGFDKISYGDELERALAYGMGKHHAPRGRTSGKYTVEPCVLGGPKSTVQAFRDALAARSQSGNNYGNVEFEIVVQFVEAGSSPMTVQLERCKWTKDASSHEEGPDPLKDEIEVQPMLIRRNGKVLFDDSEGTT